MLYGTMSERFRKIVQIVFELRLNVGMTLMWYLGKQFFYSANISLSVHKNEKITQKKSPIRKSNST